MRIGTTTVLSGLPDSARIETETFETLEVAFVTLPQAELAKGAVGSLRLTRLKRFLALERYGMWWCTPHFGASEAQAPPDVQYLLWQREDGRYGLLLPLIDGDLRSFLAGSDDGIRIGVQGAGPAGLPAEATLLAVAVGDDPYALSQLAVSAAARRLGTFRPRDQKRTPAFVDLFGWCTWDAFYRDLSHDKVLEGLQSFRAGGVEPRFMILDDGWQDADAKTMFLRSFRADTAKLPQGLDGLIAAVKDQYAVDIFGVWCTLQGYWNGVDPEGEIPREYEVVTNTAGSPKGEEPLTRHFVHPRDVHRFYQDWYSALRSCGVDMVKVDSQSSLMAFTNGKFGQVAAMRAYQQALQGATHVHFEGNLIHCMCNGTDVAYNMASSMVWRNSEDYYPHKLESHPNHVFLNALNAMWASTFSIPDWDMFWSGHQAGAFHAAARALSGGPVYVSDRPGQQNFDVLRKLCTSDGRVLRCEAPALPAADCLFTDCRQEPRLLKITNRNGPIGMLGLFNCRPPAEPAEVTDGLRPTDVPGLQGARFAVWCHEAKTLAVLKRTSRLSVALPPLGHEVVTLAPITQGFAALGLLDKYNGPAALTWHCVRDDGAFGAEVRDGGILGFYCEKEPSEVLVDGRAAKYAYEPTGLLTIRRKPGKPVTVILKP